jgi:uncharacterized protein (TIGR00297 family)
MDAITVLIIFLLSGALSAAAYRLGMLTASGAVASSVIGIIVGVLGGIEWFILLMLFVAAGFSATRIGFSKKKEKGLQEGVHGERGHLNILGVGIAPCVFAAVAYLAGDEHRLLTSIGFIASISVAAADTLASEIGVRDKNVWLCTTLKKVPPGTDGGISVLGLAVALSGAVATSMLGWVVLNRTLDPLLIITIVAGFTGCYIDSIFGATIEARGWISKYTNNALTGILGGIMAMAIALSFI